MFSVSALSFKNTTLYWQLSVIIAKSQKMFLIEAFLYQASFALYQLSEKNWDPFVKQTYLVLNKPAAQQRKTTHLLFLRREII